MNYLKSWNRYTSEEKTSIRWLASCVGYLILGYILGTQHIKKK